jgi:LemA protein
MGVSDMTALRRFGLLAPLAAFSLAGCGLNSVPTAEENVNAKWANVQSEYQRRSDLIPNLVATVKGYAQQESKVLIEVTQARADAGRVTLSAADLDDPEKVRAFNDAQNRLTQAIIPLQRLQEAYPDLKSNQNFLTLQSQLEGTENRISTARHDYINAVKDFNTEIKTIPGRWWRALLYPDAQEMQNFTVAEETIKTPQVKF